MSGSRAIRRWIELLAIAICAVAVAFAVFQVVAQRPFRQSILMSRCRNAIETIEPLMRRDARFDEINLMASTDTTVWITGSVETIEAAEDLYELFVLNIGRVPFTWQSVRCAELYETESYYADERFGLPAQGQSFGHWTDD